MSYQEITIPSPEGSDDWTKEQWAEFWDETMPKIFKGSKMDADGNVTLASETSSPKSAES